MYYICIYAHIYRCIYAHTYSHMRACMRASVAEPISPATRLGKELIDCDI